MADGTAIAAPPVDAWTTYADLTPDQRARFGRYVQAKDEARSRMEANRAANARADAALKAAGGDKQEAFALLMASLDHGAGHASEEAYRLADDMAVRG